MKIVLLTSQTLHHAFFLQELVKVFPVDLTLVETSSAQPPFDVSHPFEDVRDAYESSEWFGGDHPSLSNFSRTEEFPTVNNGQAVALLREIEPDVVIVFGTGKIKADVIATCPEGIVNLHGGDPEEYRGLDSHLWAIYHNHFNGLVTTLHRLNEEFDDGDIILESQIELFPHMNIHMLRRQNTEVCLKLTLNALDMYARFGTFITRKQRKVGRYYSFMPREVKEICKKKFERYTNSF